MNVFARINRFLKSIDWFFLLFLTGVINVKLQFKAVFILLYCVYLLYRKVPLKGISSGPAKFYLLMPLAGLLGAVFTGAFHIHGYWFGYIMSSVIWVMCAASFVFIFSTVRSLPQEKQQSTITGFFLLNALVSFWQIAQMAIVSRHIFPYWFNDRMSIYGISTGDHLQGIFFDTSTINAAISVLAFFYFQFLKKYGYAVLCLLVSLLCTSNLTFMVLGLMMMFVFLFFRKERAGMFIMGIVTIALYLIISPQNVDYTQKIVGKVFTWSKKPETVKAVTARPQDDRSVREAPLPQVKQADSAAQKMQKRERHYTGPVPFVEDSVLNDFSGPVLASLGSASLDSNDRSSVDTGALQQVMTKWYGIPYDSSLLAVAPQPGKVLSLKQTAAYLRSGWKAMLFGAGPGNFSSKLAIKMTDFKLQGTYPHRYRYMNELYFRNHFYIYMYFLAKPVSERSTINHTGSVYNQLGGEYGLAGLLAFAIFYVGYFLRKAREDKRKLVFVLAVLLLFFFEYWFELLTLTVFFELFMLTPLNADTASSVKKKKQQEQATTV